MFLYQARGEYFAQVAGGLEELHKQQRRTEANGCVLAACMSALSSGFLTNS